MRPLEIVLIAVTAAAWIALLIPLRLTRWLSQAAALPMAAMVIQLVEEGPRWQLAPAYSLVVLVSGVWLRRVWRPEIRRTGSSRSRRFAVGFAVSLAALGLVTSVAVPALVPVFHFPTPTGPYAIGTTTYHWTDTDRPEVFTADPDDRRELMVQIWYPAASSGSGGKEPWIPDAASVTPALAYALRQPAFAFSHFKYVTTHSTASAPAAATERGFPVLIFLHGFGGFRQHSTFQVEHLVSHGYIVAAIDQPYVAASVAFPDGRRITGRSRDEMLPLVRSSYAAVEPAPQLNGRVVADGIISYLAQDVRFTLDRLVAVHRSDPHNLLTGSLDLDRVGVFGPSLGGIVAAEACRQDLRLRACLMMDSPMPKIVVSQGLSQPAMWITRDSETFRLEHLPQPEIDEHLGTMRSTFERTRSDRYFVVVRGLFHLNLTDYPLVSPLLPTIGATGPIGSDRAHHIINAYSRAFFDRHLNQRSATLLDTPAQQYREVQMEIRRR